MIEFLYTALTIIGSGGVLILVIETFRDWLFKRLEEYMELAKHKINTISKNIPSGEKCVESRLGVDSDGGTGLEASVIYISNMLYCKDKISEMIGDLQLDNLDAERILNELRQYIGLERRLGFVDSSRLCYLANTPYHEFYENPEMADYEKLILLLDKDAFEKCMWYSQLIMLELNHIYKPWYGEEPQLVLRDGLKEHLKLNYPKYYKRVKAFVRVS